MPGKYNITLNPNVLQVQYSRHRVPTEAKEEIEAQLKEMTMQGTITPQVEPNPGSVTHLLLHVNWGP